MDRLNYFNPYKSKEAQHEDQLTRAYLVLLKYSSHAFFAFFEYCRDRLELKNEEQPLSFLEYIDKDWTIDTQRSNPNIETDYLLSVLITDENIKNDSSVSPSDRNAVYDGIITFGSKLTMIIENKPKSGNVWFDQLNPSKENLSEETTTYENTVVLEWKEIIKHLNSLQSVSTISGYEKIMINDFLSFVDEFFPTLNPYDNFSLCKGVKSLLYRRINNFLESIVRDSIEINKNNRWGYYVKVPFEPIKQIGLILKMDETEKKGEKNWWLELDFSFGETQNQAKSFYRSAPDISKLKMLNDNGWRLSTNFHVAYQSSDLVWFKSGVDIYKYIEYWIRNIDSIKQRNRDDVKEYLNFLEGNNIIVYDLNTQKKMEAKYFSTKMPNLNICPALGMIYTIPKEVAIEKDRTGELQELISKKIKEGLSIVNLECEKVLK